MTKEDKQYLQDNLKIEWRYEGDDLYIVLTLEGKVVSEIPFEQY